MCLIIESGTLEKPFVAEQDIKCMKVVFKVFDGPEHFTYHPVWNYNPEFQYIIGEEAVEKIRTVDLRTTITTIGVDLGLHSFKHELNGWKRLAVWVEKVDRSDNAICFFYPDRIGKRVETVVLECVIPKGSEYYEGQSNCVGCDKEETGYASNRLLPLREIPRSEWENYKDPILDDWDGFY